MATDALIEERLTRSIIGAFYDTYNALGYGFLEHVYMRALERELIARGHQVSREVSVCVYYKGEELTRQRLDMIVDDKVVVEGKATAELAKTAGRQLFNYLHATKLEVGLLLHYGPAPRFHRAICRNSMTNRRHPSNPKHAYHSTEKPRTATSNSPERGKGPT